jgi:hypothetical protein
LLQFWRTKRSRLGQPGPSFFVGNVARATRQAIGFKSLIVFTRDPMAALMDNQRAAIWLSFGANAAQIG